VNKRPVKLAHTGSCVHGIRHVTSIKSVCFLFSAVFFIS